MNKLPLTNRLYDQLKFVALVVLPALGTLYATLSGLWGLPATEQVVGTIVAVDTFLGVLLHISTQQYNKPTPR
jgi:Putative phage holin Dp-1